MAKFNTYKHFFKPYSLKGQKYFSTRTLWLPDKLYNSMISLKCINLGAFLDRLETTYREDGPKPFKITGIGNVSLNQLSKESEFAGVRFTIEKGEIVGYHYL